MTRSFRLPVVLSVITAFVTLCCLTPQTMGAGEKKKKNKGAKLLSKAQDLFEQLPEKMPGSDKDTEAKVTLGKKLYFEKNISINKTQACNSCHRVDEGLAGVDNLPTSPGALGKLGGRNSPTTLNAGFHVAQFWDGRAPDLAAQAKGPVLNPIEMAMPDEAAVLARLKEAGYEPLFKKVFPICETPLNYDNFAEAVAAFERTLITRDLFDDYLGGDTSALSKTETRGLGLFITTGCADCHQGPLLGGDRYEKMGEANPYPNEKDLGRFEVTQDEKDKFVFKVPSLRNIALTGPYFHDGKAATLEDAVRQMATLQLGEELSDDDVRVIAAFLDTLSGKKLAAKK